MIHPSYTELIEAINTNNEDDDTTMSINSRYSLVLAASKRARQLIAGAKPMVAGAAGKKPLSMACQSKFVLLLRPKTEVVYQICPLEGCGCAHCFSVPKVSFSRNNKLYRL